MSIFNPDGSMKSFFINYALGIISFVGLLSVVHFIFDDPDSPGVKSDGTIDLGLPQTLSLIHI